MLEGWFEQKVAVAMVVLLVAGVGVWWMDGGKASLAVMASEWAESCGYAGRTQERPAAPECGKVVDGVLLWLALGDAAADGAGVERVWERCLEGATREELIGELARSVAGNPLLAPRLPAFVYVQMELQRRYGCVR